jgi:hypothetical protein
MIEEVAFKDLGFNRIYTYAYDVRPKLYLCLEACGFKNERTLRFHDTKILIHSKFNINA